MKLPKAKAENIIEQSLDDEVLLYDLTTDQAYCLNKTSKIVYQACGSDLTFEELRKRYKFTDDLIYLALDELQANNLLETSADYQSPLTNLSRREALKKVGLATMIALPIVASLLAPRAADAASGNASGSTCSGTCFPPNTNFCAGRQGQIISVMGYLSSTNGSCSGPSISTTFDCASGGLSTSLDICRIPN